MKVLYCWRCGVDIPMLDEQEFALVAQLYSDCFHSTKNFRKEHNLPMADISMEERFPPVCEAYTRLTGFKETVANAVMHHRISLYGPPCPDCGKPLRTPRASFCAACPHEKAEQGGLTPEKWTIEN